MRHSPTNARRPITLSVTPASLLLRSTPKTHSNTAPEPPSVPIKSTPECCSPAREKRAAEHRSSPVCPRATPTSGSSSQHTIEAKTRHGPPTRCELTNTHSTRSVIQRIKRPFPPQLLPEGPERKASSGDGPPAAQDQRLFPRRDVSPGPAYAQHHDTPNKKLPPILTGDSIHPTPDRVGSPPGPPLYPFLMYLAFLCRFSRPGSTASHFLLSPKDRNPARATGDAC